MKMGMNLRAASLLSLTGLLAGVSSVLAAGNTGVFDGGMLPGKSLEAGGSECEITQGRKADGRRGVWQPRFWEHTIEEEDDFESHFDYIHFNPVKHGQVRCPLDWEWSSFHRWVRAGMYPKNWACGDRDEVPTFAHIEKTVGE